MEHLIGKLFKAILFHREEHHLYIYMFVKHVWLGDDGQWWYDGIQQDGSPHRDRTVFLSYMEEVTDPAEIILYSPLNAKKAPSPTRGE